MSVATWIAVGALGGLGAIARFLADGAVGARLARAFPFGTFAVNASGALCLGAVSQAALGSRASLLVGTALIGAYTTFSTWMLETHRLAEDGEVGTAAANVAVSLAVGLCAAELGRLLAGAL